MTIKQLLTGTLGLCILGVASLVVTVAPSGAQEAGSSAEGPSVEPLVLTINGGGAAEGVRETSQDTPFVFNSANFVTVPQATQSWTVPQNDNDLLKVSFTSECQLNPGATPTDSDWVEIRALITTNPPRPGFPTFLEPHDTVSPMSLCSDSAYGMHRADWAIRTPVFTNSATIYTVQIQARVVNNSPFLPLQTAWLDDWHMELVGYN